MKGKLSSAEIRSRFWAFFADKKRGNHTIIPSASLVTPDEKGITNPTLFNTAGMQPLIPYLLGKPYIIRNEDNVSGAGDTKGGNGAETTRVVTRLVDVQKCLRTVDIDDIGDKTHATFFEMLGNWSLGDYFKKEAIEWSYEFLTSTSDVPGDQGLGLDPRRLYVTVFAGDANAPKDTESASVWESVGVPKHRIYFKDSASNWWPAVKSNKEDNWTGPTGPCSEMFYDITENGLGDLSPEEFEKADQEQKVVEIWNDVFMEFEKKEGTIVGKLARKNVDTGAGLERLATVLQKVDNIYDTDLFKPIFEKLNTHPDISPISNDKKSLRIILDHIRAATFLIADGVIPSNTDRGYVLRRLIRRAIDNSRELIFKDDILPEISKDFRDLYSKIYPNVNNKNIGKVLSAEINAYTEALRKGIQKIISAAHLKDYTPDEQAQFIFNLYQSDGLPPQIARKEIAKHHGLNISAEINKTIDELIKRHQSLSRAGAEQKFKGGLADANDPVVVRYHTATHLLHQALHDVLDKEANQNSIEQKGSNITAERLRFDFSFPRKMTDEEKKRVEDIVNEKIAARLPVNHVVMSRAEAEKTGARHFFNEKYGEEISIYYIAGDIDHAHAASCDVMSDLAHAYSKEFCGGPHVKNTFELAGEDGKARFKIVKEEAVSQGVRRIKGVVE